LASDHWELPVMNASSTHIQSLLLRAQQRFNCFAAALLAPSQNLFEFYCSAGREGAFAQSMIERSADSFMTMCREHNEPVIRNRVRDVPGGPLVCRFLSAPVYDGAAKLTGVLVLFNQAGGVEFTDADARLATRFTRALSKAMFVPRDALTGLLTHDSLEKQVASWKASQVEGASAALLYGDIDQLHVINDLFGFQTGDRAIAIAGQQLSKAITMDGAACSRLSGDRFTAFVPNCS
jgi:GGDEF domain-containing protein